MCSSLQAPKNFSYHQRYCYVIENRLDTWIPGYQHTHSPGFEFVTKSIALFLFCFYFRTHNSAHFDDCCTDLLQIYKNQSCAENFSDVFFLSFFLLFFFLVTDGCVALLCLVRQRFIDMYSWSVYIRNYEIFQDSRSMVQYKQLQISQ